jgi:hypothetical protein
MRYSHALVVAGSLVPVICGNYNLIACVDGKIFVIHGVPSSDLWSFL